MPLTSKEYNRRYYLKHRERLLVAQKKYYYETKELMHDRRLASKARSRAKHRDRHNAWNKEYHRTHRDKDRVCKLQRIYGLTIDEYNEMLDACQRKCVICDRPFANVTPCVDHDHKTGDVRGLLCRRCNIYLGWFESFGDSIKRYLKHA